MPFPKTNTALGIREPQFINELDSLKMKKSQLLKQPYGANTDAIVALSKQINALEAQKQQEKTDIEESGVIPKLTNNEPNTSKVIPSMSDNFQRVGDVGTGLMSNLTSGQGFVDSLDKAEKDADTKQRSRMMGK